MISEATRQYIEEHATEDVAGLALHPAKDPQVDMNAALQQIAGRQKAKEKLPEWYAHPDILYPARISMEQCSSTPTAQYKASLVEGDTFADFSGGFGVDTAAFAGKFTKGYYVEPQETLCQLFEHNCKALGIDNIEILNGLMEDHIEKIGHVDMIYLDPSRRDSHGQRVVALADCSPNLLEWKTSLLEHCDTLMVKLSPMVDLHQTLRALPETYAVHVLAVEGECKEIICLLSHRDVARNISTTDTIITAVDIRHNSTKDCKDATHCVSTTTETESTAPLSIASEPGAYLYEPNAAIMKAGIFNSISQQYGVKKLAKSTNLYTSDELRKDFPGRVFHIEAVHEFHPRKTAKALASLANASIAVRNFPLSAEELRKTLKIKDGNTAYLFGCTLSDGRKVILETVKVLGIRY